MATLKGQNFRIFLEDKRCADAMTCIGKATNCVVTLTTNTKESSSKDDLNSSSKPEVTSKAWSVRVDALDVSDAASLLTAIKSMSPLLIMWDETSPTDNFTGLHTSLGRVGHAFINDISFVFNNRENVTKSVQFVGAGPLNAIPDSYFYTIPESFQSGYTKGQFVRLFLSSNNTQAPSMVIAAAQSLTLHVSMTLEDFTTKDTVSDWQVQEPTGISYDISTSALMRSGEIINSSVEAKTAIDLETIYESSAPVKWEIANVSGANNRTKGAVIVGGSCIVTQLTLNGPNRQNATYDAQLTGWGDYIVAA